MSNDPVVRDYVQSFVYEFLGSLRNSEEMQSRYQPLPPTIKRASTIELQQIADRFTEYILAHIPDASALADLHNDVLIRKALLVAASTDD